MVICYILISSVPCLISYRDHIICRLVCSTGLRLGTRPIQHSEETPLFVLLLPTFPLSTSIASPVPTPSDEGVYMKGSPPYPPEHPSSKKEVHLQFQKWMWNAGWLLSHGETTLILLIEKKTFAHNYLGEHVDECPQVTVLAQSNGDYCIITVH